MIQAINFSVSSVGHETFLLYSYAALYYNAVYFNTIVQYNFM
jgi:hypothetical protein